MSCPTPAPTTAPLSRDLPKSVPSPDQATLVEVFGDSVVDGGATGFVLGQIGQGQPGKPLLWIQDRVTLREAGRPCPK